MPAPPEIQQRESWAVTVEHNGESVVTLSSSGLAGRDLEPGDAEVIRTAARHLLSFVGSDVAALGAPARTEGWQPIETAPKDGTHVVLFGALWNDPAQRVRACVSWWCVNRADSPAHALGWFFSAPGYTNGFNPTHWSPLPAGSRSPLAPPSTKEALGD